MTKKKKKKESVTLDKLAVMVKRGFDETAKKADVDRRFEQVDQRFEQLETTMISGFRDVNVRLEMIERDIQTFVSRDEFDDLMARMKYVEKKLNIVSGK